MEGQLEFAAKTECGVPKYYVDSSTFWRNSYFKFGTLDNEFRCPQEDLEPSDHILAGSESL